MSEATALRRYTNLIIIIFRP